MSDQQRNDKPQPELDKAKSASARLPRNVDADASSAGEPAQKLTAEEQMALYEKDLKDNDWGHQPC